MSHDEQRKGLTLGLTAYMMWGFMPLLFHSLKSANAVEILAERVVWSFVFCVLILASDRDLSWIRALTRSPRRLILLTLAAAAIAINWGIFIWAVTSDRVVESSLGYFINPLMMVLVGVVVLHESLRRMQWIAIGIGTVAVIVLTIDYGHLPYVALALATSWTAYAFIKNRVGGELTAIQSLTSETIVLLPFALIWIGHLVRVGESTFANHGVSHTMLLLLTGPATATPLLLFSAAARRLRLSTVGLLQFLAPVMQLLTGVFLLHEHVPATRWFGFALIWVALVVLTWDSLRTLQARRRAGRSLAPADAA